MVQHFVVVGPKDPGEVLRLQSSQNQVSVGDAQISAVAVANGARVGPAALGPHSHQLIFEE